jgi:phospholipid-binding lipoprotein MlaA
MILTAAALAISMGSAALAVPAAPEGANPSTPGAVSAQASTAASPPEPTVTPTPAATVAPTAATPENTSAVPVSSPTATTAPAPSSPVAATPDGTATLPPPSPTAASAPAPATAADTTEPAAASPTDDDAIVVKARVRTPGDPLEQLNVQSFEVLQSVDGAVVEPVAKVYNKGIPRPIRQGLRNFFSNLDEPIIFGSFLLQFKPVSAIKTAGRFAINTTLGIGGVMDVAKRKPFHLPYKPNGIADTLGFYGVGPGPYFYLPIVGPTTLRDMFGDTVEIMFAPLAIGGPFANPSVTTSKTVLEQLGERAAFDERINQIRKEDDPYATYRELYLNQRKAEIAALHGRETPNVIPVYGPELRTAGGKDDKQKADAPAEAQPKSMSR